MRDYGKVAPQFWTGSTGRGLRGNQDAQLLALYLMSCPGSSMIGIFYLPIATAAFETGLPPGRVRTAFKRLGTDGIALYDEDAALAFVPNMARYQIGETLREKDKRVPGIVHELSRFRSHRFAEAFWRAYEGPFCLGPFPWKPLRSPLEGPSEPLRSQDQDQEQEQEQDPPIPPKGAEDEPKAFAYPEDFERWWAVTNKRGSKFKTYEQWVRLKKPAADTLIASWRRWKQTDDWQRGFEKYPLTWLNGRMHEQDPPTVARGSPALTGEQIVAQQREDRERQRKFEQERAARQAELMREMREIP